MVLYHDGAGIEDGAYLGNPNPLEHLEAKKRGDLPRLEDSDIVTLLRNKGHRLHLVIRRRESAIPPLDCSKF